MVAPDETLGPPLLAEWPASWYMFCTSAELGRRPLGKRAFGRDLVAFRTTSGQIGVTTARCPHLGANLALGQIVGDCLRCPFHHWEFDTAGRCCRIPATAEVPEFARLTSFPALERHGGIWFWNGTAPSFPLPFHPGHDPAELTAAPTITLTLDCPWYMIGANGIDVQHFLTTHDRELLAPPKITHPTSFSHQAICRFRVAGTSLRDCLTRCFAGREVEMSVTDWAGTLFFVQASFRRARTFGMVSMLPLEAGRTQIFVRVAVRRGRSLLSRCLSDPIQARIRRWFIHKFLEPDIARSAGTRYDPHRLIPADRCLADYFAWLHRLHGPALPSSANTPS
jgi:nitrite reductase/ring-hydroxylating ferredoxin subunit